MTDARNNSTTQVYDALNRLVEVQDPLTQITRYGYDLIGNRTVMTDANGIVTSFAYDDVSRLETINYGDSTPDVTFSYDAVGNRLSMIDGTGTTTYTYDSLYRLTEVKDGADLAVGYRYDGRGNRTKLIYPDSREVSYSYDNANRLDTVTDWNNGQFGYNYDAANRLTELTLPNSITSTYSYDNAGRLTLLTYQSPITAASLATYAYDLDRVGNRTTLTETIAAVQAGANGAYLEENGLVVLEAEHFTARTNSDTHQWNLKTSQSGYTGTSYLQTSPQVGTLLHTNEIIASPVVSYPVQFTTPGTYTVWVRGYAANAAGDSLYVGLGAELVEVTGFGPGQWTWANDKATTLPITTTGLYTLSLLMREDGLRIDRVLLTTDTTYLPAGFGLVETERVTGTTTLDLTIDRVIGYQYDDLYRLTEADYSTGEVYDYEYDPVGNRLKQIIAGETTDYLYDAANRLEQLNGQAVYTFDDNGNLLNTGTMTNTFDATNRLVEASKDSHIVQPMYNGVNDRVGQMVDGITTHFALDIATELPEVIYTDEGNTYLHLPGVIVTENSTGEQRYLLSDGLGSIRQVTDEVGQVVTYQEFDPYGNVIKEADNEYGFSGEWWQSEIGLLNLRARWYDPETGRFISQDPLFVIPEYSYVRSNPINRIDPSGYVDWPSCIIGVSTANCRLELDDTLWGIAREVIHLNRNSNAFNNERINRVMVPRMQTLNPNLYSTSFGWDCPTCLGDTINLPASWIKGFMWVPPPPPPLAPPPQVPQDPYMPGTGQPSPPLPRAIA